MIIDTINKSFGGNINDKRPLHINSTCRIAYTGYLKYICGLRVKNIAEITECTFGTTRSRLEKHRDYYKFDKLYKKKFDNLKDEKMSLDVTLYRNYLVSYDEGVTLEPRREEVYSANITHNLGNMAEKAGLYKALWRPYQLKPGYDVSEDDYTAEYKFEEANPVRAYEIIEIIEKGLEDMKDRPKHYEKFNSSNGWGMYHNFVPWIEEYLKALKEFPDAFVECDR